MSQIRFFFQHGMAYGDFKDLAKRTAAATVLCYMINHLILLKIQNMMNIKEN